MTQQQFVQKYYQAVASLVQGTGILPETVLSVAILESSKNGQMPGSELASTYNNYFGIKATGGWAGPSVDLNTGEYNPAGSLYQTSSAFRVYQSFIASASDFLNLLTQDPRYQDVATYPDSTSQFQALQQDGYSTNPTYASTLSLVATNVLSWIQQNPGVGSLGVLLLIGLVFLIFKQR